MPIKLDRKIESITAYKEALSLISLETERLVALGASHERVRLEHSVIQYLNDEIIRLKQLDTQIIKMNNLVDQMEIAIDGENKPGYSYWSLYRSYVKEQSILDDIRRRHDPVPQATRIEIVYENQQN